MHVAALTFDQRSQKWVATFGGKVLAASANKAYVVENIRTGRCKKAAAVKVTSVREIGAPQVENSPADATPPVDDRFGINERFDFLTDFVAMVADRTSPSLLVTGEGGLGKTFTVNKALQSVGLKDASDLIGVSTDSILSESESRKLYTVIKGYSSAKGLYRLLYENRNRIIVFDDCDSVLRDPTTLLLLKGALDSYEKRVIYWNVEMSGDDDLPRSFEFKGGVIFVSNLSLYKIDSAVRSRCICVDLTMNADQKIERMAQIIKSDEFMPSYEMPVKVAALEFLKKMKDQTQHLNFRTLISVTRVVARGGNWHRRAEYLMMTI